ncbi:hypothetical protein CMV_006782 [Castanea mollissima]|uniref:J domain-containing protein n=1 Tax=Castanea mollissima TaxID=60419 RepID=A0A8J4RW97_9ROSI|nr:hypothetical protein CMV_006782 [Castanea mollissima]
MDNEKAAEAFKKLQNAYEVLLDTEKQKTYDDELIREELLNLFRRFQSTSQTALAALIGVFVGFNLAILVVAISGTVFLWFYGSFWTTAFVIFLGGLAFMLSYERIALLITTVYSIYCAWAYVGWLGLLIGLNFSLFSSDVLMGVSRPKSHQ